MNEFEKELEKNMELNKVAYKRENICNDFLISKRDIEHIFEEWQPKKPLVEVPKIVADYIETQKDNNYNGSAYLIVKHYDSFKDEGNDSELNIWIANNFNDFLNAIVNGYTVKKEKLFYLKNVMTNNYLMQHKLDFRFGESDSKEDSPHWQTEFNQSEIDSMKTGSYERIEVDK